MKQFRHGDLLLVEVGSIPETCRATSSNTVLEGEFTGHAHRVDAAATVLVDQDGTSFVRAHTISALTHEEHARIEVPAGLYRVVRQREFWPSQDDFKPATPRWVAD